MRGLNGYDKRAPLQTDALVAMGRYLGTSLPYVTVITGTHIPALSANHNQPFVIPPKNSSRTPKRQVPPTARRQAPFNRRRTLDPAGRPTINPRLGNSPLPRSNPPPTPSADRDPPNWPSRLLGTLQTSTCLDSRKLHRQTACPTHHRHPPWATPTTHLETRDESPRCCRQQQPGASPERRPPPTPHPPSSLPPPHPASPRRQQQQ